MQMIVKVKKGNEEFELMGEESVLLPLFFSAPWAEIRAYAPDHTPVFPDAYRPSDIAYASAHASDISDLFNDALGG